MADDNASHNSQDTDDLYLDDFVYSDDESTEEADEPFTPLEESLLEIAYDEVIGNRKHLDLDSESESESVTEMEGAAAHPDISFMSLETQPESAAVMLETQQESAAAVVSAFKPPAKAKGDKFHSIIHDDITKDCVLFFSIDVETGGDRAGILQISAEAFTSGGVRYKPFDEYVKPPVGASISARQSAVHGLTLADPRIQSAATIEQVWPRFVNYVEGHLNGGNKKGVMVAWGGQSCDCEWLFRVTEVWHPATLRMPNGLDFFLDPSSVIRKYTSCRLNKNHSRLEGYGLATVWCYANRKADLAGAHSLLVDCKAQTDVVLDDRFRHFIDRYSSIMPMAEVWKKKREKAIKQVAELSRAVPEGWTEDDTTTWKPPRNAQYTGSEGGGICGPSSAVKTAVAQDNGLDPLVNLFYFTWRKEMLQKVVDSSEQYGRGDWVKATTRMDADGNPRKRFILQQCSSDDPDARHRHPDHLPWKNFSVGLLLAFFSILMFRGAYGLRSVELFWESPPDGVYVPFIQNLMVRDTFRQVRRYLRLAECSEGQR